MFAESVVCCQVEVSASGWLLVLRSPTDCGASCVWSRIFVNEGALAHWGAVAPKENKNYLVKRVGMLNNIYLLVSWLVNYGGGLLAWHWNAWTTVTLVRQKHEGVCYFLWPFCWRRNEETLEAVSLMKWCNAWKYYSLAGMGNSPLTCARETSRLCWR